MPFGTISFSEAFMGALSQEVREVFTQFMSEATDVTEVHAGGQVVYTLNHPCFQESVVPRDYGLMMVRDPVSQRIRVTGLATYNPDGSVARMPYREREGIVAEGSTA